MSKEILQVTFKEGKIFVTDPCYEPFNGYNLAVDVLPGTYKCSIRRSTLEGWGQRIVSLTLWHEDHLKGRIDKYIGSCGVDSGQLGVFDAKDYLKNHQDDDWDNRKSWYRRVCDLTLNPPDWGTIAKKGVVSTSGLGDGVYPVYASYDKDGKVVGLRIKFI